MNTPQYLLRFDDICPTMNWKVWTEIETILVQRRLKPILAVVPDNHDPVLKVDSPAGDFWDRVRLWQDRGWTIALHGFQHRYVIRNAGLVARMRDSEFAGLPANEQREKLRRGIEIFRRKGIRSSAWIAPSNTFDRTTVALLPDFGIHIISAGYFQFPYVCSMGLTWVPQQMHYFRPAPAGVWTVCYHHNYWDRSSIEKFREDLHQYRPNLVSLEQVTESNERRQYKLSEWLCTHPRCAEFLIRLELKLWSYWAAATRKQSDGASVPAGA